MQLYCIILYAIILYIIAAKDYYKDCSRLVIRFYIYIYIAIGAEALEGRQRPALKEYERYIYVIYNKNK